MILLTELLVINLSDSIDLKLFIKLDLQSPYLKVNVYVQTMYTKVH